MIDDSQTGKKNPSTLLLIIRKNQNDKILLNLIE